ncbi:MAG TPA: hypothetical protein VLM89_13160 [Phycisphaerae bacterium]|nr:hypothetical protein [Phycisphaerae bacterium]
MADFAGSLYRQLSYLVSLPERTVRSLAAMAGGTIGLLSETLFPESLRDTTLYRVFLGDTQRFMVEKIAQVRPADAEAAQAAASADPQYMPKKMLGTALETAGLFAMHLSPLWVFAIASDAAAGSNTFLARLVEQLRSNGVILPETNVDGLSDLLAAVQDGARQSAAAVDTPPLSREELSKLADDMTQAYGRMFSGAVNLMPRLETLWDQMERIASRDNISLEAIGGILSIDVASWGRKGIGAALALGQTGTGLFGEKILDSYSRTLETIGREGVTEYVGRRMQPFMEAAAGHFDPQRKTWMESLMTRWFGDRPQRNR